MTKSKLDSASDIEDVAFDILKGSKALGVFPTPIDQIVQYAELKVSKKDLTVIPKNYLGKASEALKRALRKARGALDRRKKTIYLDLNLIPARNKFTKLHETGHHVLPWQKNMYEYIQDDKYSLDPDTEEGFEAEASFFASSALFQLDRFEEKLKDLSLSMKSAMALANDFGSSKHAAIRRYVEKSNKRCALIVLKDLNKQTRSAKLRNYFQSPKFSSNFGNLEWPELMGVEMPFILDYSFNRRFHENGQMIYYDENNGFMDFQYHFFYNGYNVFVLLMPVGEKNKSRVKIVLK
jgi:Zn-dependent peptidase ImmA (M78 family)